MLTPYAVAWVRAFSIPGVKRNVLVCGAQMGKTDNFLDLIGERLDTRPAPILYVGPSKEFITGQFEPRLVELFEQSSTLGPKVLGGLGGKKQTKTLKRVAGVRLRLAHAGSSTALKSDPAAMALIDEYDEMLRNVRGQGDVLGLVEARGFTYADFWTGITSTCSRGVVSTFRCEATGLDFWSDAETETLASPIWALWQEGTRAHWTWTCPECGAAFIPRKNLLRWPDWPKVISPAKARRTAWLECPHCEAAIVDDVDGETKAKLNAAGYYTTPAGHEIRLGEDGGLVITGPPIDNSTWSWWVSGLASPFVSWGERLEKLLQAIASGETKKEQTATNAGFGELYAEGGGEVPAWTEVRKHALPYKAGEVPAGVMRITAGVDVQKNSLIYVIRGWGARGESWLIEAGDIWGDTSELDVWNDLADLLTTRYAGKPIVRAFVDSGFRPGKKFQVPEHRVYDFCRRYARFVYATKGYAVQRTPIIKSRIEVEADGKVAKYGLDLLRLDTDHWKTFVHDRVNWPMDKPGAWHLHENPTEDYCRQIVSEARTIGATGKPEWHRLQKDNHFLDAEAMASAAGYMAGALRLKEKKSRKAPDESEDVEAEAVGPKAETPRAPPASDGASKKDRFRAFATRFNR